MANESPQSILALTYARIDHLAWALGSLSHKGAEYEGKLREIQGWEKWLRGLGLLLRGQSGAPAARPNGVPVSGVDVREFEYLSVDEVRGKAFEVGVTWPGETRATEQLNTIEHKIDDRKNVLHAVIELAKSGSVDAKDPNSVWAQLVKMAESNDRVAPLLGFVDGEGVKYQKESGPEFFTLKNLRDRMYRARDKAR